ncbi:hypothetical protein P43SY_011288 [Pythium insidiosum]|uniref:Uncharacterized protein n=1 Tax=Pythium insidiosum TaxID=114742 RepID=A0AAD5L8H0_PYTIN|nr:hypothetical protein P43SY_011288 [Pythium insidiosum]
MLAFINGQLASTTDATIGGVVERRDCDRVEVSDSIDLVSFEMPRLSCADTITEHINSAIARPPVVGRTTRADEDMQTAVEEVISAFRDILYGNDEHGVVGIFQQYAYEPQSRIAVVPVIVISAILEEAVRSISRAVYPAAAALFETQSLFWGAMDDVYALESDLQDAKVQVRHARERVSVTSDEKDLDGAPEGQLYAVNVLRREEIVPSADPDGDLESLKRALSNDDDRQETTSWAAQFAAIDILRRIVIHHADQRDRLHTDTYVMYVALALLSGHVC